METINPRIKRQIIKEGKEIADNKSYEYIITMLTSFDNRIPEHRLTIYKYTIALKYYIETYY